MKVIKLLAVLLMICTSILFFGIYWFWISPVNYLNSCVSGRNCDFTRIVVMRNQERCEYESQEELEAFANALANATKCSVYPFLGAAVVKFELSGGRSIKISAYYGKNDVVFAIPLPGLRGLSPIPDPQEFSVSLASIRDIMECGGDVVTP